jgi:hypothetical protein
MGRRIALDASALDNRPARGHTFTAGSGPGVRNPSRAAEHTESSRSAVRRRGFRAGRKRSGAKLSACSLHRWATCPIVRRSSGDGIGDSDKVRFPYTVSVTERGEACPKMAPGLEFVHAAAITVQQDRDSVNSRRYYGCPHEHRERARRRQIHPTQRAFRWAPGARPKTSPCLSLRAIRRGSSGIHID